MALKLKPSARMNRRYLLLQARKEDVEETILEYIGVLGWAKASPLFVSPNKKQEIILVVERKSLKDVRAAFELSKKQIKVLKVSGTLKGLRN